MEIRQTFTFCDNCNLERAITADAKGVFAGTFKQAMKEGWEEDDFGHVCPECLGVLADSEDEDHGAVNIHEFVPQPPPVCASCDDTGWAGADFEGMMHEGECPDCPEENENE